MREHPAQGQAAAARRPDRAERALPPGPLKSGMVDDFIARKAGKSEVKYELAQLEPILADTYGVIAYQEQVMRIASRCSPASASASPTSCARPWARKIPRSWPSSARRFIAGRRAPRASARRRRPKIFDLMEYFAGYGFNKSHSTAYALPRVSDGVSQGELPAALRGGAADDRGRQHRQARALHRRVPRSRHRRAAARHQREPAALHGRARRRALRPDRHQGARRRRHPLASSTCARASAASRRSISCARSSICALVNKRVLEALVKSGACDTLDARRACRSRAGRAKLLAAIDSAIEHGSRTQRDRDQGQADLFGGGDDEASGLTLIRLPDAAAVDRDGAARSRRRMRSGSI